VDISSNSVPHGCLSHTRFSFFFFFFFFFSTGERKIISFRHRERKFSFPSRFLFLSLFPFWGEKGRFTKLQVLFRFFSPLFFFFPPFKDSPGGFWFHAFSFFFLPFFPSPLPSEVAYVTQGLFCQPGSQNHLPFLPLFFSPFPFFFFWPQFWTSAGPFFPFSFFPPPMEHGQVCAEAQAAAPSLSFFFFFFLFSLFSLVFFFGGFWIILRRKEKNRAFPHRDH